MRVSVADNCFDQALKEINGGGWCANQMVPTIYELMHRWEVSKNTVSRVLKMLREQGYIVKPRGSNRYYLNQGEYENTQPKQMMIFQRRDLEIAEKLRTMIFNGSIRDKKNFPTCKQIQSMFLCSYRTAAKVLEQLLHEGLIVKRGRRYYINSLHRSKEHRSAFYIIIKSNVLHNPRYNQFITEAEKSMSGWGEIRYIFKDQDHYPADYLIAGLVLWGTFTIDSLRELSVPHVVIDEASSFVIDENKRYPPLACLRPDNVYAGQSVGTYLAELGHKKIAFISHLPEEDSWLLQRIHGLQKIFPPRKIASTRSLYSFTHSSAASISHGGLRTSIRRALSEVLSNSSWYKMLPSMVVYNMVLRQAELMSEMAGNAILMQPLFEAALKNPEITAWVCVNDQIAFSALKFLETHRVSVPDQISVIGYDNLSVSAHIGLSSFDFRFDKMGHHMVELFSQGILKKNQKPMLKFIKGEYIPRNTSGPVT